MELEHLLVEVRNAALERVGAILPEDLKLEAEIPFNTVGSWTITIASEHPLTPVLGAPGGGILVTDSETGKVLFSGPTVAPEEAKSTTDVGGSVVVQGITDDIILDDYLAWPQPSNGNIATQTVAHDQQTGISETLMHYYVQANVGADASEPRRNTRLVQDGGLARGAVATVYARFDKLLTLCQNLSLPDRLGFRVVQDGQELRFETYLPSDLAREVRLSIENDSIASARFVQGAPTVTRAIVAGKGGAVTRVFAERSNTDSLEAERLWGRRIERFVDRQDSASATELERAGDEALADGGYTGNSARFEPTDTLRHTFGSQWFLGDIVSIESGDREFIAPVTGMALKVDSEGLRVGATLGDPAVFAGYEALKARLDVLPVGAEDDEHDLTGLNAAFEAANEAAAAAADAAANATIAQQAANGKNKVTYSLNVPGATANTVGDIWFRKESATQTIIGQWEGLGGTSWSPKTLSSQVIANLDAGKLTAGSAFINGLTVKTNFDLGDASSNGVIQSYNFAGSPVGVFIDKNGIVAKGGTMTGTNIVAANITGTSTITGATVQTSSANARGVKLDSFGLAAFRNDGGGGLFAVDCVAGRVYASSNLEVWGSGGVISTRLTTNAAPPTGAGANCYINGDGLLAKSTSSERYKENIQDADLDASKILALDPKSYTHGADNGDDRTYIGFIAEQAHELGLTEFVDYDAEGLPDGFYYGTFVAAQQVVIRQQDKRITDLEARLARIEAALENAA